MVESMKGITDTGFRAMRGGVDLNGDSRFWQSFGVFPGGCHEHRQDAVRPTHGFPAMVDLRPVRCPLRRRQGHSRADMRGSVPDHGLRATDLPRESARYRSLPVGASHQALPHGVPARDQAVDAGRCQRNTGLAYPCRVRPAPDRAGAQALCGRQLRRRAGEHSVCAGLDHHRSVPVAVSVGAVSHHQVGSEDAHAARPSRQHSQLHPYLRRQAGRCQGSRHSGAGTRSDLRHGSRLPGFQAAT